MAEPSHPDTAFLTDFARLSEFGATGNGGVERQAASAADGEQRRWLGTLLQDAGAHVYTDRIGNQYGLFELSPGAPYVLVGSHLDSQPTAGKYDGAYGVLAGAHAAIRLSSQWRDAGVVPRYNVGVVNWFSSPCPGRRATPARR